MRELNVRALLDELIGGCLDCPIQAPLGVIEAFNHFLPQHFLGHGASRIEGRQVRDSCHVRSPLKS